MKFKVGDLVMVTAGPHGSVQLVFRPKDVDCSLGFRPAMHSRYMPTGEVGIIVACVEKRKGNARFLRLELMMQSGRGLLTLSEGTMDWLTVVA